MSSIGAFASYLVNALWEVTLIAGAGWLAGRLLRRLGPRAEHVAWVWTLVIAVFTPAVPLFRSLLTLLLAEPSQAGHASMALAAAESAGFSPRGVYFLPSAAVWSLLGLCAGSTLFFAARFAWSWRRTTALLRSARLLALTPEQDEVWRRCRRLFSIGEARLMHSPEAAGPLVLGLRRPALILPSGFTERCALPDLLIALAHECAHLKRRDFHKNLIYEAGSLVLAFHPAIWAIKAQIAQTREMVCDSMVTEKAADARAYAHSLLRLAAMAAAPSQAAAAHAIGIFDANILEKRIMTMNLKKPHVVRTLKLALTVSTMLFLVTVAAGAAAAAVIIEPQSPGSQPGQASPYGHVYKIGKGVTAPVPLNTVEAKFSDEAIRARYQGVCLIQMIVDAHGMPQDAHVIRHLGMGLDQKALEAVRQYRFKPAMRSGKPVAVAITVEVNFKLYNHRQDVKVHEVRTP